MLITVTIPQNATPNFHKGEKIARGDILYRIPQEKDMVINVAQTLSVKPDAIFNYLTKMMGETIKKTEVVAKKKRMFSTRKIYAPHEGILKKINHHTGEVTFQIDPNETTTIYSYFTGTIEEKDGQNLKIRIDKGETFALEECVDDWGGETFYLTDGQLYFTEEEIKNKVVIVDRLTPHIRAKCEALGTAGFICREIHSHTGLPFARIKTKESYQKLLQHKKHYVILSKIDKIGILYD